VHQILLNLPSTAIKFTGRGGRISVKAEREGAVVVFEVADTGVGIAAADLPRLGEPFFQAAACYDRRYEGTGLGLSIVKGLVKLHNGEIDFRSRVGEGTRVIVRLPVNGERVRKDEPPRTLSPALMAPIATDYRVKKIA
jgi:two-component system, cell cycle sensor histidine kinase DivJ